MLNEDQLALRQMCRRMTSLRSSTETLQSFLDNLQKASEQSPALLSAAAATLEFLSLMTAGLAVLQSETERLHWTNDSAPLLSLKEHWRTAYANLNSWGWSGELLDDCECNEE